MDTRQQQRPNQRIEDATHDVPVPRLVDALCANAFARTDRDAGALVDRLPGFQPCIEGRRQVDIHEAGNITARALQARQDCGGFPTVWLVEDCDASVVFGKRPGCRERIVIAAVVDDDELEPVFDSLEVRMDTFERQTNPGGFVVDGNDDADDLRR